MAFDNIPTDCSILDVSKLRNRVIPISRKVSNPLCPTVFRSCASALSWAGLDSSSAPSAKIIVHFTFVHSVNVLNIPNTPLVLLSSPGAPSRCLVAKMSNTISLTLPERSLRTHDAPHHIAPLPPNLICNGRCRMMMSCASNRQKKCCAHRGTSSCSAPIRSSTMSLITFILC